MPTHIEVSVVPGSRAFAIGKKEGRLKVWLTEEAERGKANLELAKRLSGILGCGVSIVRGHTGRRKLLAVQCSAEELETKLAALVK